MKTLLLVLLVWFTSLSCKAAAGFTIDITRPDYALLVNRTHTERTVALFDYYDNFLPYRDSATIFSAINTVRDLAKQHHDDGLELEADLMQAHYYAYRYDNRLPELTKKLLALIKKAQTKKALWLEARIESLLGTRLFNNKQYESGMIHLSKAVELLQEQSPDVYPIKQIDLYLLGNLHYNFKEYDTAIKLYKEALEATGKYDRYYYYLKILNEMASAYRLINQLDSSNVYFERVYKHAVKANDILWQIVTEGNLAENYYLQGNFKDAEPLLKKDLHFCESRKGWDNASHSLSLLGDIALHEKNVPLARQYITKALQYAHWSGKYWRLQTVYPELIKLYAVEHKPESVTLYMDSAFMINDSLKREFDHIVLARANQKLELEKIALETERLKYIRTRQIYIRNSIIGILLFIMIVGLMLFNKHRLEVKNREIGMQAEKERMETELQLATARLGEFLKNMQLKNSELERAEEELESLRSAITDTQAPLPLATDQDLEQLQQTTILTEEDWHSFKQLFEKVHTGFFERLKTRLPGLSPADIRFIALTKLKLSPKEMAGTLGVGADAIRQYRSRLRKKLALSPDDDLENLVAGI